MTNVTAFTEMLKELLLAEGFGETDCEADRFPDTGPMPRYAGMVVHFLNGDTFQLTIVQRASGPEPAPAGDTTYNVAPRPVAMTGGRS